MIQYVSLLTESVIRDLGNSTIIIQTQNPWIAFGSQLFSVIVGGTIALIANYFLQKHSFNIQNETNLMNLRIAAYSNLIGHISNYESISIYTDQKKFIEDMGLYLVRAAVYGSQEVKTLIIPEIKKSKIEKSEEFSNSIGKIKGAIVEEIAKYRNQG